MACPCNSAGYLQTCLTEAILPRLSIATSGEVVGTGAGCSWLGPGRISQFALATFGWLDAGVQAKVAEAKGAPVDVKSCAPRSRCTSTGMDLDNSPLPW
jgi:hypothetical protein